MSNPIKIIYNASKRTLNSGKYPFLFLVISLVFFSLFIFIPVFSIPGNSLAFQLGIFSFWNYVLMIALSSLIGLMISMQLYVYRIKKSAKDIGGSAVGGFSSVVAGLFGTASCSSCVAAIFGFLGLGTVLFLIKYQWYIVGISLLLMLISIYLMSSSIEKNCGVCK